MAPQPTSTKGPIHAVYLRGQPVNLLARFYDFDPVSGEGTPGDPDAVEWETRDPNGAIATYIFGTDPEVTNPQVGLFLLSLPPLEPVGSWAARCESSGSGIIDAMEYHVDVLESAVLDPDDKPRVAVTGPCQTWIDGDDVIEFTGPIGDIGSDTWRLDDVAYAASSLMWSLTARQFPGVCEMTTRPCPEPCGHFAYASGIPWYWGYWSGAGPNPAGWWFWNEDGGVLRGCAPQAVVRLAGYPVRDILEVLINGEALPELDPDSGAPNWILDGNRKDLIRMNDPNGGNVQPRYWPGCQDMRLADDQPGTFSVRYTWGSDVPILGRMAAAQLARELWLSFNGGKCALPSKVTKAVRQGLTIERIVPIAQLLRQGGTGIPAVDMFIADVNPQGSKMRSAVYSPDVRQYGRRVR